MTEGRRRWRVLSVVACLCAGCNPITEDRVSDYAGDARRGQQLAREFGCGACHVIPGVPGAQSLVGPSLHRMGRRGYIAGRAPNTEGQMVRWLLEPEAIVPGTAMPAVGLNEAQARDIAAFLRTLD